MGGKSTGCAWPTDRPLTSQSPLSEAAMATRRPSGVTICSVDGGVLTVIAGQLVIMWPTRLQRGHLEMRDWLYPR